MTTEELVTEVLGHQFNQDRYHDRIVRWLNEAQSRVYAEGRLTAAEGVITYLTEPNENTYDFTYVTSDETVEGLINVRIPETDVTLQQLDIEYFDALPEETGTPTAFVIFGDEIAFYPTPTSAMIIEAKVFLKPTEITEDDDPVIQDQYQYLLTEYALMKCYAAEHDDKWANYHQTQFEMGLLKMRGEEQQKREGGTRVVPGLVGGNLYG